MHHFNYKDEKMFCEDVEISAIAVEVGTPFYLYSTATLRQHFKAFNQAFHLPHVTCFAVKSCSNLAILRLFATMEGGADIVSGGELFRALRAGVDPKKIVYSGVGKTAREIREALQAGILLFNVESEQELDTLHAEAASLNLVAPVSFRVNPDVDPKTHAYISTGLAENKFGIPIHEAEALYRKAHTLPHTLVAGVSCHIGSQLTQISPFIESLRKLKIFINRLHQLGIAIQFLDIGGGLGITYNREEPPHPREYADAIKNEMADLNCTLILEPGRVIVGNAGILVSRVLYTKRGGKNFVIVDAAMNDLARPSLYGAYHRIQPVNRMTTASMVADLVGPICETGDFLSRDKEIPVFERGDLVAVMSAGAYGFSMSSNYNSRPRVAEVLVDGASFHVIRQRETYEDLVKNENIPAFLQ
jgi:diaminopimelate decarboxylase